MESIITAGSRSTPDPVYSNFDHVLNESVVAELKKNPNRLHAQHAAWGFCGEIWWDGEQWIEEVWVYGSPVTVYRSEEIMGVINAAINGRGGS